MSIKHLLFGVFTILIIAGCTDEDRSPAGPGYPEYWMGEVTYACGNWYGKRPDATHILADVAVHTSPPTKDVVNILRSHGAYIRHIFNVSLVRVIIDIDTLESLYYQDIIIHAWGVPDPDSKIVKHLIVSYDHAVEKQDSVAIQDLGVVIDRAYKCNFYFSVSADDKVIPRIFLLPGVNHVHIDGYACHSMDGLDHAPPRPQLMLTLGRF